MNRILIIDDDKILSKATAKRLEKRNYLVTVLHSGKEGLELLQKEEFDLCLLDIMMPRLSGIETLVEIRKNKEKHLLPIIMVSSCEESQQIIEALDFGANDYITKPININILTARVSTQIEIKELTKTFALKKRLKALLLLLQHTIMRLIIH